MCLPPVKSSSFRSVFNGNIEAPPILGLRFEIENRNFQQGLTKHAWATLKECIPMMAIWYK